MGELRYSCIILDLGIRWRSMISFTPLPLYPQGKSPRYPLHDGLAGRQSQSGRCGVEKDCLSLPGIEPRPSIPLLVPIPTELPWLLTSTACIIIILLLTFRYQQSQIQASSLYTLNQHAFSSMKSVHFCPEVSFKIRHAAVVFRKLA
jgi:hypothetical protein